MRQKIFNIKLAYALFASLFLIFYLNFREQFLNETYISFTIFAFVFVTFIENFGKISNRINNLSMKSTYNKKKEEKHAKNNAKFFKFFRFFTLCFFILSLIFLFFAVIAILYSGNEVVSIYIPFIFVYLAGYFRMMAIKVTREMEEYYEEEYFSK